MTRLPTAQVTTSRREVTGGSRCSRHLGLCSYLDRPGWSVSYEPMPSDELNVIDELRAMQERVRSIRTRHCEPKSNTNPRYLALSNVVSNLGKVINDIEAERS